MNLDCTDWRYKFGVTFLLAYCWYLKFSVRLDNITKGVRVLGKKEGKIILRYSNFEN